jgi:hypothetical protein
MTRLPRPANLPPTVMYYLRSNGPELDDEPQATIRYTWKHSA